MAMASSYSAAKTFLFAFFIFPLVVLGDIRNHTIISKDQEELFLDSFSFIETSGRLQLKLINISFPNNYYSNDLINLSHIGFFLSPHKQNYLPNASKDVELFPYPHIRITTTCFLHQGGDRDRDRDGSLLVYTLDKLGKENTIIMNKTSDYVLYFQNCVHNLSVKVNVQSEMYNLDNAGRPLYLSPTKTIVIKMNFFFSLIHLLLACFWGYYILHLKNNELATVTWIHVLMIFVPFFKAWSLLSEVLHHYYILYIGCAQCYPSLLLTFAFNYLAETPLLLWLVVFFTGWSLSKPTQLLHKDKWLIIKTVYIQIVLNMDIFLTDTRTGNEVYHTEPGVFSAFSIFFKMHCLYKGIRSYREFLKELESGKESVSVRYTNLFNSLFIKYVIYYACQRWVDYNDLWIVPRTISPLLSTLLKELIVLVFYIHIALRVRHELHNPKLLVNDDDARKGGQ